MNQGLSIPAQNLAEYAARRTEDAVIGDAVHSLLGQLAVPYKYWGELTFAAQLDSRWHLAIDNRKREVVAIRDRFSDTSAGLLQAAADYSATDIAAAANIAHTSSISADSSLRPLLGNYTASARLSASPGDTTATVNLPALRIKTELPKSLDTQNLDTTGRSAMLSFRNEHLGTIKHAEQLLRGAKRLDFIAPSEYLSRLNDVCPGAIRHSADAAETIAANLNDVNAQVATDTEGLCEQWQGSEASVALNNHSKLLMKYLAEHIDHMNWLHDQGTVSWQTLDGLLQDVADDAQSHIDTVHNSRIGRIAEAIELVQEAMSFSMAGNSQQCTTGPATRQSWAAMSSTDVDATVQVLYKRVWYLSHAFGNSVDKAAQTAQSLIDNSSRPASIAATLRDKEGWRRGWTITEKLPTTSADATVTSETGSPSPTAQPEHSTSIEQSPPSPEGDPQFRLLHGDDVSTDTEGTSDV